MVVIIIIRGLTWILAHSNHSLTKPSLLGISTFK